jgi:DNA-directed RNA polymerase subunit RPC12/RpoP
MSEFKFACPVCGQHITADSTTSGGQIECPTCFQKIVVPQAPASVETKFILSAAQVSKPRPVGMDTTSLQLRTAASRTRLLVPIIAVSVLLVCAVAAGIFFFHDDLPAALGLGPRGRWSLNLKHAIFPETQAAGKLRGRSFTFERSTLVGSTLSLREGQGAPLDMGISIPLGHWLSGDVSGRAVDITPGRPSQAPRITLSWRDEPQKVTRQYFTNGYALKVAFDQTTNGRAPGRIYLCLSDEAKSVVAGTFNAAIQKPKPPAPKAPKPKPPPPVSTTATNG